MDWHGYMISSQLYRWIRTNLKEGSTILELGSGDGTKLLAEHYKMISIEHNKEWLNKYKSTYLYAPLDPITGWYDVPKFKEAIKGVNSYDLILVDAPPGFTENARMGFYDHIQLFNVGVPIIIDDTHRPGEALLAKRVEMHLNSEQYPHERKKVVIDSGSKNSVIFI